MEIQLSQLQAETLKQVINWHKNHTKEKQYLTLGGYAGTGKTTLLGFFRADMYKSRPNLQVAFCSYTGKAARVLRQKLVETRALYPRDKVSTIHMLIYSAVRDDRGLILGWERKSKEDFEYDLIIIDEASMLNESIWNDLLSYGVPILAVGDHGQLPPIQGQFNLMENPELRLEEIFRQQAGNPIIRLSELARSKGEIPFGVFGRGVRKLSRTEPDTQEFLGDLLRGFDEEFMVLVGYNNSRVRLNQEIRRLLEFESDKPRHGDRVVALRNNHNKQIFNGMTGTIINIIEDEDERGMFYDAEIQFDGEDAAYRGDISIEQFGNPETLKDEDREGIDLLDFGYALTVHKAQGSQAQKVVVFEERFKQMDDTMWRRWLYTAVTRATDELYLVG